MVANVNIFSKHNKNTKNEKGGMKTLRMVSDMFLGAEYGSMLKSPISG